MKNNKFLFQKYNKKYSFLQDSLFDFLYWRSCNLNSSSSFVTTLSYDSFFSFGKRNLFKKQQFKTEIDNVDKINSQKNLQNLSFLNKEHIYLSEYWKSSSIKKVQHVFQNLNKNIFSLNYAKSQVFESSFVSPNDILQDNQISRLKTLRGFKKQKTKKALYNFSKLKISQTRKKNKKTSGIPFELSGQTFIPKTHFLQTFQNLQFFGPLFSFFYSSFLPASQLKNYLKRQNQFQNKDNRTENFFPKKKNFQQYWIFPLLGFVLLFCSQSSFLKLSRDEKSFKNFQNTSFLDDSQNKKTFSKIYPSEMVKGTTSVQNFDYAYGNQKFKNFYTNFQKLEKNEFQHLSSFYSKILQKSFSSFSFDQPQNFLFFELFHPLSHEQLTLKKQNTFSILKENFSKNEVFEDFERNRNIFAWNWYNYESNEQKNSGLYLLTPKIPQKAQFFGVVTSLFDNSNSISTPFFDFSKSFFLFNEFEKNLAFFESNRENFCQAFYLKNFSKIFTNSTSQDFLFFNLPKSDILFQNNKILFNFSEKNSTSIEKSRFFKHWLNTTNGFLLSPSFISGQKLKKNQITNTNVQKFYSKIHRNLTTENFQFLDSIYFQKVYQKHRKSEINSIEKIEKISQLNEFFKKFFQKEKFGSFQNVFFPTFENLSNNLNIQNFKKISSAKKIFSFLLNNYKNTRYPFFEFKKRTFQFLSFQSFHNKSKKTEKIFQKSKYYCLFNDKNKLRNEKVSSNFFESIESSLKFSSFKKNPKNLFLTNNFHFFGKRSSDFSITRLSSPIICDFSNIQKFDENRSNSILSFSNIKSQERFLSSKNFTLLKNKGSWRNSNVLSFPIESQTSVQSTIEEKILKTEEKISKNLNFFQKKQATQMFIEDFSIFEKFLENFFKKLQAKNIFSLFSFDFFQQNFFFEKLEKNKAICFQKHENFETIFSCSSSSEKKTNQFFKKNILFSLTGSNSFILKLKSKNMLRKQINRKPSRKFEKVFQTFFSPLNSQSSLSNVFFGSERKTKHEYSISVQKKVPFFSKYNSLDLFRKDLFEKKEHYSKKVPKDKFLLKILSNNFLPVVQSDFVFLKSLNFRDFSKNETKNKNKIASKNDFSPTFQNFVFKKTVQKQRKKFKNEKISPEFLLKRDGFVFIPNQINLQNEIHYNRIKLKKNIYGTFSDFINIDFERFEKEKSFQKKRRLKKQKLETRRRKKRKRFFPRPIWLRFHLYKKFLKTRHPLDISVNAKTSEKRNQKQMKNLQTIFEHTNQLKNIFILSPEIQMSSPINNAEFFTQKFYKKYLKRTCNDNFFKTNLKFKTFSGFVTNLHFLPKNKLYRKNIQKSYFSSKYRFQQKSPSTKIQGFYNSNQKPIISTNPNHYKISADILSEFLRLSWKSYWFQTHSQPYTYKISQNFKKMLKIESQNNFNITDFFGTLKYSVFFGNSSDFFSFDKDLISQKSQFKKFLWYSNIRNSIESNPIEKNSFNFQKIQNIPEYNRILYARVSELIRRFKFSENTETSFSFDSKTIKRKDEKLFSNPSIFTKSALFFEKFHVPSEPSIPAFSLFSSLFHDCSIKPTGDMATLRSLWAFQKTNLFHFQETNPFRNLWTFQKRLDNLKSFKATKKMVNFVTKYSEIDKINRFSANFPFEKNSNFNFPSSRNVDSFENLFGVDVTNEKWKKKTHFVPKSDFLISIPFHNKIKEGRENYLQNLDNLSFQKFRNIEKKCSLFGIRSFKQNSKLALRYFKFQLLSNRFHSFNSKILMKNSFFNFDKNLTYQNSPQSSLNFWWAQKNWSSKDFVYSNSQFFDYNFLFPSLSTGDVTQNLENNNSFHFQKTKSFSFFSLNKNFNTDYTQIQFLFFTTFIFHLAIFLTLFKLPEIRSVFKFQCLVFYKVLHSFFGIFFTIHNLFQKYTEKSLKIFKLFSNSKIMKNSFSEVFQLKNQQIFTPQFSFQLSQPNEVSHHNFSPFILPFSNEKTFLYSFFLRFSYIPDYFKKNEKQKKQYRRKNLKPFFSTSENNEKFEKNILGSEIQNSESSLFPVFSTKKKQNENDSYEFFFFGKAEKFSEFVQTTTISKIKNQLNFDFSKQKFHKESLKTLKNQRKIKNFQFPFQIWKQNISMNNYYQVSPSGVQKKGLVFLSPKFGLFQYFLKVFSKTIEAKKERKLFSQIPKLSRASHNIQKISKIKGSEKIAFEIALSLLFFGKRTTLVGYNIIHLGSNISSKIFEVLEAILFSIYKFLEKPAELMIEWIALIFLIEWSSDIATFVPDTLDTTYWKTSQKIIRQTRSSNLFLNTLNASQSIHGSILNGLNSLLLFHSLNLVTYILQKRMFYFTELFFTSVIQPDVDILVRQKKGMIFWDIWAEILLKAAEKYNVNIPSFVTLKEEQEIFIEKLLQDREFFQNFQNEQSGKNFSSFLQNFLVLNRPEKLFDPNFIQSGMSPGFANTQFSSTMFSSFRQGKFQRSNKLGIFSDFSFESLKKLTNSVKSQKSLSYLKKNAFLFSNRANDDNLFFFSSETDRWSASQYGTYQGSETDLFIDIHPSKSLKNIHFLKYYEPAQYTLGSIICQVYSGLFSKQVSKNILVIGAQGTAKTLFIQALAGETEMKLITDNAYRYSMVQRGVAVGMKYLRDVFDAIALQTPCFFLLEHIHVIGSKRPLLISDDENVKGNQSSFGLEQQEVHETNQMIYQSSRHSISDFKRPYKGDFSMGIATNFFIQNFASQTQKNSSFLFQNSQFSGQNFSSQFGAFLQSPLPIDSIESVLNRQGFAENSNAHMALKKTRTHKIQTSLQFSKEQIFAPPATSPFTVLMMKEQKRLKPKKIVKEISWGGLSADQIVSYQKETYSIRAKVASLADITMNLSRGKLDMITDLLVIIDSVRSNRGFVVFGTTHLPSLLDPALRRPGRFDETLSLAQSPNFFNRFEILRINLENSISTFDFLDSSILTENFSEINLFSLITETKLSFFHQYKFTEFEKQKTTLKKNFKENQIRIYSQLSSAKAFQTFLKSSFLNDFYDQTSNIFLQKTKQTQLNLIENQTNKTESDSKFVLSNSKRNFKIIPKGSSHTLTLAYSQIGIFLSQANLYKDPRSFTPLNLDKNKLFLKDNFRQFVTSSLYEQKKVQKLQLMVFLSGKITEFFIQKNKKFVENKTQRINILFDFSSSNSSIFDSKKLEKTKNSNDFFKRKFSLFAPITQNSFELFENKSENLFSNVQNKKETIQKPKFFKTDFFWTAFGNDESWRSTTPFLFALVQKRLFFTKNLLLSKMLFFDNNNQRRLPPSPPNSSILMPAKKYENYKRTEIDFLQKARFSINEKIQMHQKQRFLKQLYNIPVQKYFRSEVVQKRQTFFSSSFQELAYLDSLTRRSSSSHFYQQKYLGFRHSFSHINQWWNGMLPEHNTETTYLSDVDWRTIFIKNNLKQKAQISGSQKLSKNLKSQTETFEFTMDFPDAEQYYNPRNRRWYLNTKKNTLNTENSNYWLTFDLTLQYEIYYHFLMLSFHKSFEYFDIQREMLDFSVFQLLNKGFLNELDFVTTFSRFQIK